MRPLQHQIDRDILRNEIRRAAGESLASVDFTSMTDEERERYRSVLDRWDAHRAAERDHALMQATTAARHDAKRMARESAERIERSRKQEIAPVVTGQGTYAKPYTPTVCDVRRDWAALAWGLAPWAVAGVLVSVALWILSQGANQ